MKPKLSAKKLLIAFLLLSSTLYSQTVNKEWASQINETFSGIDKNKIPHSLLKDYAMEFIELNGYDGTLTNENYVHKGTLTSIYNTLLMARVKTNVPDLVAPTVFKQNWDKSRKRNFITLSGLYYKYSQFKENAYPDGLIKISNEKLYDKYNNGVWQNPYEEKQVFAITSPTLKYKGLEVDVELPQNLWYTNQENEINQISIDFGDGKGYVVVPFGATKKITYDKEGIYDWEYMMELKNGQKLFSHSAIQIEMPLHGTTIDNFRLPTEPCTNGWEIDMVEFTGTQTYANQFNTATLEIDYADNDCIIKKPLIVAEGFDSGLLGSANGLGDNDYLDFIQEASFDSGDLPEVIKSYDIIYINWDSGRDYLQRNALLLQDIIAWVNSEKQGNEPNVVLGQSMGGVIARYALADMEQQNMDHDTSLYISHDAPHQGANIPLGILYFARHMVDQFVSTPIGDLDIDTGNGGAVSIEDIKALIDSPGTRQLLKYNVGGGFSINNTLHDSWEAELQAKGYPQLTRNIAISNASHCGIPQNFNPNDLLFSLNGNGKTSFLTDYLLNVLGPIADLGFYASAIIFKEPGLLLGSGILPGSSKFGIDFWAKALPEAGQSKQIYKGRISYTKKVLWTFNITVNLTNKGFNNPSGSLPYDYYPGGQYRVPLDFQGVHGDGWYGQYNINSYVIPSFNFIPSVSALDIGSGTTNLYNADYLRAYTALTPPTGNKAIPFDNFITGFQNNNGLNEVHISFSPRNGTWLAKELDEISGNEELFDCTFGCSNLEISGLSRICDGGFGYSVPAGADSYLWNVIGGDIVTIDSPSLDTNSISISRNGSNSGWISIGVRISSVKCGVDDLVIVKDIYVGAPTVESISFINTSSDSSGGTPPNDDDDELPNTGPELPNNPTLIADGCEVYLKLNHTPNTNEITDIEWEKITTDIGWSKDITNHGGNYVYLYPTCNKEFKFRVKTKSDCGGWSQWQEFSHTITACSSNCSSSNNNGITSSNFSLYPVPTNTFLNISVLSNHTWSLPASTTFVIDGGNGNDDSLTDPDGNGGSTTTTAYTHPTLGLNLSFYNNMGILVYSTTTNGIPAQTNIPNLPSGIYVLAIEYQGQVESHHITIN